MARTGQRTRALRCCGTQFVCEMAQIDTVTLVAPPPSQRSKRKCLHPRASSSRQRPTSSKWHNIAALESSGVRRGSMQPKRQRAGTALLRANNGARRWRRGCAGTWATSRPTGFQGAPGGGCTAADGVPGTREVRVRDSSQTTLYGERPQASPRRALRARGRRRSEREAAAWRRVIAERKAKGAAARMHARAQRKEGFIARKGIRHCWYLGAVGGREADASRHSWPIVDTMGLGPEKTRIG